MLVFGATPEKHEVRLTAALDRLATAGVTLNSDKCEFYKNSIHFLGHLIDRDGIRPNPSKLSAILQVKPLSNVTEVRRLLGMTNQLGKFTPKLATLTQPLRELLTSQKAFVWGPEQGKSFQQVKTQQTQFTILSPYSLEAPTKVSADTLLTGCRATPVES